jgi:hypothetical protein
MGLSNSKPNESSNNRNSSQTNPQNDVTAVPWMNLLKPAVRGPAKDIAKASANPTTPSTDERQGVIILHNKANILRKLCHVTLMDNFLESTLETFALTPAEMTQLLLQSYKKEETAHAQDTLKSQIDQYIELVKELSERRKLYQRYLKLWKQGYVPSTAVMEEQSRINALESQLLSANSTQVNTKISRDDQLEQSKQASVSNLDSRNRLQNQLAQYIAKTTVFAPAQGIYMISRNFFNGSFVRQGQELITYSTAPPYLPSTIPVFLDAAAAEQVSSGMSVLLTPKGISRAQYGGIPGKVVEVSKTPLDADGLQGALVATPLDGVGHWQGQQRADTLGRERCMQAMQ